MKKGLLGLLLVVILGYGGATFYFGNEAEGQFKNSITAFNDLLQQQNQDSPGPKFQVALVGYSKGLLSSTANLKISMDMAGLHMPMPMPMPMANQSYELPITVHHGPFIFSAGKFAMAYATAKAEFPKSLAAMAEKQLSPDSTLPQLDMSLLINLDSSARMDVDVPEFKIAPKAFPGKLDWKGLHAHYNLSKDMQKIDGAATIEGMTLDSPFANANVSPIEMEYDVSATKYGLWVGFGKMDLPSIDVTARGKPVFKLDSLAFDSSADINNGLLSLMMTSNLKKLLIKSQQYGPLALKFNLGDFDAQAFADIQAILQKLNNAKYLPKKEVKKLMASLEKLLPNLLNKGANINLENFTFKLPQGSIDANFKASVPKGAKITHPMDLPGQVLVVGQVQLPKILLESLLIKQAVKKLRQKQMLMQLQGNSHQEPPSSKTSASASSDDTSTDFSQAQNMTTKTPILSRSDRRQKAKEQVDNKLKKLVDAQILLEKDNSYLIKFKYDKGHMFVNDKPVTPDMLEQ